MIGHVERKARSSISRCPVNQRASGGALATHLGRPGIDQRLGVAGRLPKV